ncbi:MAG: DUF1343 domain-containing protein [Rikenellaceae bacterium]
MVRRVILTVALFFVCNVAYCIENGADQIDKYIQLLDGKRVGIIVNQTSRVGQQQQHLLDTLLSLKVDIQKIFTPEHGFRGDADAGEHVDDERDSKSGLPIVSLYGSNRRPSSEQLKDIDLLIFDIQDVGARFYTYISTLYYIMQSCSTEGIELIVLDRPNPNDYIDGPIITPENISFVGALPIPILHGLTVGELAQMINGEGWSGEKKVDLTVIPISGWKHGDHYSLPIKPSPNLPNDQAIALYPSLCLFEATKMSIGRGTYDPFQIVGYPNPKFGEYTFTPKPLVGFEKHPLQNGVKCYGLDLRKVTPPKGLTLSYFIHFMQLSGQGAKFISSNSLFDRLVGDSKVREMLCEGKSEEQIKATWQEDLDEYRAMRGRYLLYNDYSE